MRTVCSLCGETIWEDLFLGSNPADVFTIGLCGRCRRTELEKETKMAGTPGPSEREES